MLFRSNKTIPNQTKTKPNLVQSNQSTPNKVEQNTTQQKYIQIKSIQHQLLSITKYIDSTKYIEQNGQIVDVTYGDNWENIYLQKYKTPEENDDVITLKKELLDIDLYNKTQIKNLSYSNVVNLENAIRQIFSSGSDVNEIRISNL